MRDETGQIADTDTFVQSSVALEGVGIRFLSDEKLQLAMELQGGITDDLEQSHSALVLTNRRVLRYTAAGHKKTVVTAALDEVDSIEMRHTERNRQWVWVSAVFILGGLSLAAFSLIAMSSLLSPLLMAFALALIGIVFLLTYVAGTVGEVIIRAGAKDIKCKIRQGALEDAPYFVQRVYELKLGYDEGGARTGSAPAP